MEQNTNINEEIVAVAMEIIMNAGDARVHITEALQEVAKGNIDLANEKLQLAHKEITLAHGAQTGVLQKEANGQPTGYSVLFAHAQDTLMTINSELNMAKQLIKVFKSYEDRISVLERKMEGI
ncbi:PTS lactose/cellobiose transporter subunit IIA [Clostridium amazonitimonense]|uniref:PTS lactose/cellobiose transporter subunit IIA n=1 Tax=Clostridium amazonitimonense TaxID=1499689 RepID=UPI000AFA2F32|nr:PTS lactose/cellobiose transporter subunit IIA [Clostridium amazonitimonense]